MTKQVNCGGVLIGGGAPVSIQSMTNVDTRDGDALLVQINELADAGCEIVRVAIPDEEALASFARVRKKTNVPLVADIHFSYKLAIGAIKAGADKIRINPGNIGSEKNIKAVVDAAKERNVPIRVGVNSGSLTKEILKKNGGVTAEGLVESAIDTLAIIENLGYDNLVLSIKSSNVKMNYDAHMLIKDRIDYPLHIGITESGTPANGQLKSAVGLGALLLAGVGDTIRVSLTSDPVEEVIFARKILETVGIREKAVELVSCPTCGRTEIDLISLASEVEVRITPLAKKRQEKGLPPIKVAVMGCIVNGPGESRESDYGIAGGKNEGLIFVKGDIVEKVPEDRLVDRLLELIEEES